MPSTITAFIPKVMPPSTRASARYVVSVASGSSPLSAVVGSTFGMVQRTQGLAMLKPHQPAVGLESQFVEKVFAMRVEPVEHEVRPQAPHFD